MVIALFGDSCTGKSTIAAALAPSLSAEVFSGKDYLKLAKSESMAAALFQKKLRGEETILYVISEKDQLAGGLRPGAGDGGPCHHQGAVCRADARESARPGGRHAGAEIRPV